MNDSEIRPLILESSTSESTTVEVVINDLRDGFLSIPDYQRDSDQWDETTKSLFVESIINNLSIPAFFFEVIVKDGTEKNEVVDGQQRLTTLRSYFQDEFSLVGSDDAPYLSPNSVHYAAKKFSELPAAYQQAFKKYRLTTIKLRNLDEMRLEVFRRINQGGTPLSGQDIRLAYYGARSPTLAFVRLVGVYEPERQASRRFIDGAKHHFQLEFPWPELPLETWKDWWAEKDISRGQTASEMFLWALVSAQPKQLDDLLKNKQALEKLNCRYNKAINEVLDVYCAQLRFQDDNSSMQPVLMVCDEVRDLFFPHFASWIDTILRKKGISLTPQKYRVIASVIGAAYRLGKFSETALTDEQWSKVVEFIRRPQDAAKTYDVSWPMSKGRWDGTRGYYTQMQAAYSILEKITK